MKKGGMFWYVVVFGLGLFVGVKYLAPIVPQLNETAAAISDVTNKMTLPKVK